MVRSQTLTRGLIASLLLFSGFLLVPVPVAHSATALDGNASNSVGAAATTCAATLTTTSTNDIIIALGELIKASDSISGVSGASLTWTRIPTTAAFPYNPGGGSLDAYYAVAASALTAQSITETITTTGSRWACDIFGVSGAATSGTIFDPNAALAAVNTGTTGTQPTVTTVSTSDPNDFVVAFMVTAVSIAETAGTLNGNSMTIINVPRQTGATGASEYYVASSTFSSVTATFTGSPTASWDMAVFGILPKSVATTNTIAATVSVTPAVNSNHADKILATVSIAPVVKAAHALLVKATVSITPAVSLAHSLIVAATISITPLTSLAHSVLIQATITITPHVGCLWNFGGCLIPTNNGDPLNYLWLFAIPAVIAAIIIAKKR